jgi:hypothetical protein
MLHEHLHLLLTHGVIALSQRRFKHREIQATYQSESLHHFYDSVAWNPRNAPVGGVLYGAAGHVSWSPEGAILNPSVMHCFGSKHGDRLVDFGGILEGSVSEPVLPRLCTHCVGFTGHLGGIDKWARWG